MSILLLPRQLFNYFIYLNRYQKLCLYKMLPLLSALFLSILQVFIFLISSSCSLQCQELLKSCYQLLEN